MPDLPVTAMAAEVAEQWRLSGERLDRLLAEGGCPLCRVLARAASEFMRLLCARTLPEPIVRAIRDARGFCLDHAWELHHQATEQGLPATGVVGSVHDVLAQALAALGLYGEEAAEARLDPAVFKRTIRYGWTKRVARRLEPSGRCPICLAVGRIEETLGYQLLALLGRDQIRITYRPDSALCLPHFRWALDTAGDRATLDCLVDAERRRLEALLADRGSEAWACTLGHVVGAPGARSTR